MTKRILLVDLKNFAHRARSGFDKGEHAFLYNFVRGLRSMLEDTESNALILVKEGSPKHRYDIFPEYKANRKVKEDDPKAQEKIAEHMELKQKIDEALGFCLKNLECYVAGYPNLEADDVIADLATRLTAEGDVQCVVASTDGDFAQLLFPKNPNIDVWNPSLKEYLQAPEYDPVVYKALTGDKSDNIPGIRGYGPKKARKLAAMAGSLPTDETTMVFGSEEYQRNLKLVKFASVTDEQRRRFTLDRGKGDLGGLMVDFMTYRFNSLLEGKAWEKMQDTFGSLKKAFP